MIMSYVFFFFFKTRFTDTIEKAMKNRQKERKRVKALTTIGMSVWLMKIKYPLLADLPPSR